MTAEKLLSAKFLLTVGLQATASTAQSLNYLREGRVLSQRLSTADSLGY